MRLDQGPAVAAAPAGQPGQRALGFIDGDAGVALLGRDLALRQVEMLTAEGIDRRPLRFRRGKRGRAGLGAYCGKWHRRPLFLWDTLPIFRQE